jgi:hypothetical protein
VIRITLSTHPRAGTIQIQDTRHELATWHNAGAPDEPGGLLLGTTTDGQRVTLATEAPDVDGYIAGALCIGNDLDAPRWTLANCRKNGATLEGMAFAVPSDAWMAAAFGEGWDAP